MIELLDQALRALFRRVPGLTHESQIRFQPPDEQWRTAVTNLQVDGQPAPSLNVFLTELRQNRELRSTERHRSISNGVLVERLAPSWLECHYLISAWSPAASELVEPALEEHGLLHRVVAALQDAGPINPSRIYPAGAEELAAWQQFAGTDLPTELLPQPGFGKLAEFWGTMGAGHRWKPVVQLVVGLPVVPSTPVQRGRPVVTVQLSIGPADGRADGPPAQRDVLVRIGGRLSRSDGTPVDAAAQVAVVADELVAAETTSDPRTGRYLLDLPLAAVSEPDRFRLRARLAGLPDAEAPLNWRAASHDLVFPGQP